MKNKVMILVIIFLGIIMSVFLVKAFGSIQKADLTIEKISGQASIELEDTAKAVMDHYDVNFVDEVSLKNIKLNVLLVDHINHSALIIENGEKSTVNYNSVPTSVSYCNTYIVRINNKDTMIVNVDPLLGDSYIRTVAHAYHYRFAKMNTLNPETIDYFISQDQDITYNFNRYMMIESAKQAYLEDGYLDEFYYYYDEWSALLTDDILTNVVNYDYYDGLLAYVKLKVALYDDPDLKVDDYLNAYKNQFDIYDQDDENEIMGLLYCLLAEREGVEVIQMDSKVSNPYSRLLSKSVIGVGSEDEDVLINKYNTAFISYIDDTIKTINKNKNIIQGESFKDYVFTSESYDSAITCGDDTYIYKEFKGRLEDGSVIERNLQVVKITSFYIYYMDNQE